MGIFDGYMLVSDMDGTLFSDPQTIPQNNIDALRYFTQNGGRFTIATGRSVQSIRSYLDVLPINAPVISTNGAQIYDLGRNECLFFYECNERATIAAQKKFADVSCFVTCGSAMYSPAVCAYHEIAQTIECTRAILIDSLVDIPVAWNKVLFFGDPPQVQAIYDFIAQMQDDTFDYVMSADYIAELLPKNVNKGIALSRLCELTKFPISRVFAIGDYYNDLEMLKVAGVSAAPLNAPDDIQQAVDFVCCDHKDGAVSDFVNFIERSVRRG